MADPVSQNQPSSSMASHVLTGPQLLRGHRKPARTWMAAVVALLSAVVIVASELSLGLAGGCLLLMAFFIRTGHTFLLFLFCVGAVTYQIQVTPETGPIETGTIETGLPAMGGAEYLTVISVILMLIAGFRYSELCRYANAMMIDKTTQPDTRFFGAFLHSIWKDTFRSCWVITLLAVTMTVLILTLLPADDRYLHDHWLKPKPGRLIILALWLFFGWFVSRGILSAADWWSMSPERADVALRSWYNRELWKEQASVEKRLEKINQRAKAERGLE